MKVTGLCLVSARECRPGLDWRTLLRGRTLLDRALSTLAATANVDEVRVLTDLDDLAGRKRLPVGTIGTGTAGQADQTTGKALGEAPVGLLPSWFFDYKLAFHSKEHWLLARAQAALAEAGVDAEVIVHLDWRTPLVSPKTLERMYHALLDDRVAARTAGMHPVDPNLFIKLPGRQETFFPVWADPGADRQMIPQLYQTIETGAVHVARMLMPIPETKGIALPREEGLFLASSEHLDLADFYLGRRLSDPQTLSQALRSGA